MNQECFFNPKANICPYGKWNNKTQSLYCNVKGGLKNCPFDSGEEYQKRRKKHEHD
jgi:hypothetical protein